MELEKHFDVNELVAYKLQLDNWLVFCSVSK